MNDHDQTKYSAKVPPETAPANDASESFAGQAEVKITQLFDGLKQAGSPTAIILLIDPENPSIPLVHYLGHKYDATALTAWALRKFHSTILPEIGAV